MTLLSVESVSLSHWRGDREIKALREASLTVAEAELVAVYGKASAGKTSLLQVAAGLASPDAGHVWFEGRDLRQASAREIVALHRAQIAWVEGAGPRSRDLAMVTYVALALYREVGATAARRRAMTMLERVGALPCADQTWEELTDTERVLVAIAHAAVRGPRLLVVDDPTRGLGMVERERVVGLLRGMADDEGVGVLMAVPDMPAMLPAHQILLLNRGRVMAPPAVSGQADDNVVELRSVLRRP